MVCLSQIIKRVKEQNNTARVYLYITSKMIYILDALCRGVQILHDNFYGCYTISLYGYYNVYTIIKHINTANDRKYKAVGYEH